MLKVTWGHPQVAVEIAQWISVKFKVQVSLWLVELQTKGSVTLPSSEPAHQPIPEREPIMESVPAPPLTEGNYFSLPLHDPRVQATYFAQLKNVVEMYDMEDDDRLKSIVQSGLLNSVTRSLGGVPGGQGPNPSGEVLPGTSMDPLDRESSVSLRAHEKFKVVLMPGIGTQMGKKLAAKYRELNEGKDPPLRDQYVSGTIRKVKHYTERQWVEFGDEVMKNYFIQKGLITSS